MGTTEKLGLTYPSDGQPDHFTILESLFSNLDAFVYGSLRARFFIPEFGSEEFALSGGTLSWSNDLYFSDPYTGNRKKIVAGSLSTNNYDFVYFDIQSETQAIETVTLVAAQSLDVGADRIILGLRVGDKTFWVFKSNSLPSSDQSLLAADSLTVTSKIMRVVGNGGGVTLTSTPTLDVTSDGTEVIVQGTDDTNTVTFQDESNLAGSKLQLAGGADCVLGKGDTLYLIYDAGDSNWYEISRSNN